MSVMSCISSRSHRSVRHKNSTTPRIRQPVQPHKNQFSIESGTKKSLYLKTDHRDTHFRSGLVLCVALLQWDLVLSEVESSICLCPGWNELGVCRVLQTVVERRVLTASATERGHISPGVKEKHSWTEDYSAGPMASVLQRGTVGKTARWLYKQHYYSQVFAGIYQEL